MADVVLEVWSDVLCPWCFIGTRNLATALDQSEHDVAVAWRAFQLDPGLGTEGVTNRERLVAKFGGEANYEAATDRVRAAGAAVGIDFDPSSTLAANTLRAHQLVAIAADEGKADPVVAGLFSAQFELGRNVADPVTLSEVATAAALDDPSGAVEAVLADERLAGVQADIADAAELGIRGIPTFVAERRVGVSGAVPPATLMDLFDRAVG
jgi:predicted DsbA family dithiol-disulfide isomerase